jgi:NAD(P)-dependent dehydrogenase (short-subunit alcohol dehydrogenase family)
MSSDNNALAGHRVVVLGAGSNLGRALARSASAAGADVVLAGRDPAKLEATLPDAERVPVDIADEASIADDVVQAVLYAMTSRYVTGTVLHVDGGGRLA